MNVKCAVKDCNEDQYNNSTITFFSPEFNEEVTVAICRGHYDFFKEPNKGAYSIGTE